MSRCVGEQSGSESIAWQSCAFPVRLLAGGVTLSPLQTQSTSPPGVLIATDWGPGTTGVNDPLIFNQFNPKLGVLNSINITLTTNIRNDYELIFVATPVITTIDVATSQTTDPSVLSDPAKRATVDRWSDRHALWPQWRHAALRRTGDDDNRSTSCR